MGVRKVRFCCILKDRLTVVLDKVSKPEKRSHHNRTVLILQFSPHSYRNALKQEKQTSRQIYNGIFKSSAKPLETNFSSPRNSAALGYSLERLCGKSRPACNLLRPTPLAGSNNLAQSTRPRETRCKTSYAKRFTNGNVYIHFTRQGPRGWVLWKTTTLRQ